LEHNYNFKLFLLIIIKVLF